MIPAARSHSDPHAEAGAATSSMEVAPRSWTVEAKQLFRGKLDILVAGGYDYERFIFMAHARALGVQEPVEVSNRRDFRVALFNSQRYNEEQPFVVFLGDETWLDDFKRHDMSTRPPYVVNMSAVDVKNREAFNEHLLSSCTREEVTHLLCRALDARKPEPAAKSSGSDPDGANSGGYPSSTGFLAAGEHRKD